MIRKSKTTKKRQGWLGNARGSGGEAAKAHHKMRCVKKLVQEKGGKAKLPWWSLSEGRISVGVDVVSRGNHRAFSRKRTRTEEKVRTWSKSALRAKIRPYFEKNGTSTRFDWISCRRRRLRRGLFWSRLSLFALWEVLRSILKSV